MGWSIFAQRALWGVLAGGVASFVTTPFDVLTTSVLTASEETGKEGESGRKLSQSNRLGIDKDDILTDVLELFGKSFNDILYCA